MKAKCTRVPIRQSELDVAVSLTFASFPIRTIRFCAAALKFVGSRKHRLAVYNGEQVTPRLVEDWLDRLKEGQCRLHPIDSAILDSLQ